MDHRDPKTSSSLALGQGKRAIRVPGIEVLQYLGIFGNTRRYISSSSLKNTGLLLGFTQIIMQTCQMCTSSIKTSI